MNAVVAPGVVAGAVELEVVLHVEYGGFSLDTEMALWLLENRGWTVVKEADFDYERRGEFPLNVLVEGGLSDHYYHPRAGSIAFRAHPDLRACVRALHAAHAGDSYDERRACHVLALAVVTARVVVEVEDHHDGQERLTCRIEQLIREK